MSVLLPAHAAETNSSRFLEPSLLTGSIYPKNASHDAPLFTFRRTAHGAGATVTALREYFASDHTVAARESVEYRGDQLKSVAVDELQTGDHGTARFEQTAGGQTIIHFEYQVDSKHPRTATETQSGPVLINDTLPTFISENWTALTNGQTLRFRYVVIARQETIAFTLHQSAQEESAHGPIAELEMRPANWLVQRLLEPILFTVELQAPHRILQYTGRSTPKVRHGRSWDDLDAVTVFDWAERGR